MENLENLMGHQFLPGIYNNDNNYQMIHMSFDHPRQPDHQMIISKKETPQQPSIIEEENGS